MKDQSAQSYEIKTRTERANDPTSRQMRAADPDFSVWVPASAGSGKTKVLTDRLLRLLLPRGDGRPGTAPHRILCLTYTKAAANEMALRLNKRLGRWAVISDDELVKELEHELLNRPPSDEDIKAARALFARVVDAPGGLKVMTIHSFCQSVLGRFPLEAGLPPHFTPLEESEAQSLMTKARNSVLEKARHEPRSLEGKALSHLAGVLNEEAFSGILSNLIGERHQLAEILKKHGGPEGVFGAVSDVLGIPVVTGREEIIAKACAEGMYNERGLRHACRIMTEKGTESTDRPRAVTIQNWLDEDDAGRIRLFASYCGVFLKNDGGIYAKLVTGNVKKADEFVEMLVQEEAERILAVADQLKAIDIALATRDLLILGSAILEIYQRQKSVRAALDFDDLINYTLKLLQREGMASWVMYKLDGGLDHILVDEAQDTNPEQWEIIRALTSEFFSGDGARADILRTLFSVGDEKQSIYSFQRAAPAKFREMQAYFSERVAKAGLSWRNEPMQHSFRSSPAVLNYVDEVFRPEEIRKGLGLVPLEHIPYWEGRAGRVEVWPVFSTLKGEDRDPWAVPLSPVNSDSGAQRLAEYIAGQIKSWCSEEELPSKGRLIEPGDILVLVRKRGAFVNQLIRALKLREIPVSGVDRMILKDELPVQDLLAIARFALLPEDDLSLACVLKSPLIGLDDEALEALAVRRPEKQSLWAALIEKAAGSGADIDTYRCVRDYLEEFVRLAGQSHPYEFFSKLLQHPCPGAERGGLYAMTARLGFEAVDPLEEFLSLALAFERNAVPTLQQFVQDVEQGDSTIKREQEEAGGRVRIMTVHGAKGLQAPIVILPDTTRTRSTPHDQSYRLIWPDKSGLSVPLWSPRKETDCEVYQSYLERLEALQDEEYRRLFYVALTRAEDRLYIGGYTGKKDKFHEESWYNYALKAAQRLKEMETVAMPEALPAENEIDADTDTDTECAPVKYVWDMKQTAPVKAQDRTQKKDTALSHDALQAAAYSWIRRSPLPEPEPARPLTPSRPSGEDEAPAQSPLAGEDRYRFRRGEVTHRLLQFLPDISIENRFDAAKSFIERHGQDLPQSVQEGVLTESMAVLKNPEWAALFGPESQAEVPLTGMVGTDLVSGQVDRMIVLEKEVWIVDYKTNRPPPQAVKDVPKIYARQMGLYKALISQVYPGFAVRCFLLWTDGPVLMALD